MTTIAEGYIPQPDGRIWYRIVGANQPGLPLLCLHGGPGAAHDYLEPLEACAAQRPVIFYDQMGCGNSDRPGDPEHWTIEAFVEELDAVRTALNLDRLHVLGQSWGTILAAEYIFRKGAEGIISLIQSSPVMSFSCYMADQRSYLQSLSDEQQKIVYETENAGDFENPAYQEIMMNYYREHLCRVDPWPDCLNRTFAKLDPGVYEYMQGPSEFTVTGTLKEYDRVADLKSLQLPVLYTCGECDTCTPRTTKFFQHKTPGAECVVFEGASHEHHLEKTADYLAVIGDFMHRAERER